MLPLEILLSPALAEEVRIDLPRPALFRQLSYFTHGCLTSSPPVNVMADLRPMHDWLQRGRERQLTDGRFDFSLTAPDPSDETWMFTHILQTGIDRFNTRGWGPSTMTTADLKALSAMQVTFSADSALIHPQNTWHAVAYTGATPPTAPWPGTVLWPERCTYTASQPGPVPLDTMFQHCATVPHDATNTKIQGSDPAIARTIVLAQGETVSLADALQKASGPDGIEWSYICTHAADHAAPVDPSLGFSPTEVCLLRLGLFGRQDREHGRVIVEFSEARSGASNCPALAQP